MDEKKTQEAQAMKEAKLKVMSSDCGCTYLGDGKAGGLFVPPGIDIKQQTSHCGKMGGSSGNCDFL